MGFVSHCVPERMEGDLETENRRKQVVGWGDFKPLQHSSRQLATCRCRLLLAFTLLVTRPSVPTWRAVCLLVGGHAETPAGVHSPWETVRGLQHPPSDVQEMAHGEPPLWAVSLFWRRGKATVLTAER